MRNVLLLAALFSPLALSQSLSVEPNSLMRLPGNSSVVQLDRLDVAEYGTLLLPANLVELKIGELHLAHEARIVVVPAEAALYLEAQHAELGSGSQVLARGAPGTHEKPPTPGRDLVISFKALKADQLSVDARGGNGAQGYFGLDGANGQGSGCVWGAAGRGANGSNGGDGLDGAAGGNVRLAVPRSFAATAIKVQVQGGAGGLPGTAGEAGAGGSSKGCLVYRTAKGRDGRPGLPGQAGSPGREGSVVLQPGL